MLGRIRTMNNFQLTIDLTRLLNRYNQGELKAEELRKLKNILSVFREEVKMDMDEIKRKRMISDDEKRQKSYSLI